MNLDEYRTLFVTTSLVLILVAMVPVIVLVVSFDEVGESFSELWLLGSTHMAEGYPSIVTIGEEEQVFIGIGNHMGHSAYYLVYVKLRNQTQNAPNSTTSTPSSLVPLYEFRTFVADGDKWESSVAFSFLEVSRFEDKLTLEKMSVNDVVLTINRPSAWDPENSGFFYQLLFELWIYDEDISSFRYHNRFVGLRLNTTG